PLPNHTGQSLRQSSQLTTDRVDDFAREAAQREGLMKKAASLAEKNSRWCKEFRCSKIGLQQQGGYEMKVRKITVCLSLLFFLTAAGSLRAQEKSPADAQTACRSFVQGFYNWYVQKTKKAATDQEGGFSQALKYK